MGRSALQEPSAPQKAEACCRRSPEKPLSACYPGSRRRQEAAAAVRKSRGEETVSETKSDVTPASPTASLPTLSKGRAPVAPAMERRTYRRQNHSPRFAITATPTRHQRRDAMVRICRERLCFTPANSLDGALELSETVTVYVVNGLRWKRVCRPSRSASIAQSYRRAISHRWISGRKPPRVSGGAVDHDHGLAH